MFGVPAAFTNTFKSSMSRCRLKQSLNVIEADEKLTPDHMLEMVSAGMFPATNCGRRHRPSFRKKLPNRK